MKFPQSIARRPRTRTLADEPRAFSSAHLIGICGTGMKALAELLVGLGWRVSGSDLEQPSPSLAEMSRRGLRVHRGHHQQYLPSEVDVVVYSHAVTADNAERIEAARRGIPQFAYSQMLGHLMKSRIGIGISGTHGKSTTTAMTASILEGAGVAPSVVIGAELCASDERHDGCSRGGHGGWAGKGPYMVVESCEYKRSFLDIQPRYAAILGIEPDHFDYYADFADTELAFAEFASRVSQAGMLIVRGDDPACSRAAAAARCPVSTFSEQPGSDWWATDLRIAGGGTRFRVFHRGQFFAEIGLQIPGRHNVLNALAAVAVSHAAGISQQAIRDSLAEFRGVRRRYEHVGSWRGVKLIDDYAHHPTAVRTTLETARLESGERKVWCVFQPHQTSRTRALMDEFAASFSRADVTIVVPAFAAREVAQASKEPELIAEELVRRISANGVEARYAPTLDRLMTTLDDETRPGDVLVLMGAGDINRVHHEFARRLQRHHALR